MSQPYLIDTSALTQAHRVYYPFDIAPSFWAFMKAHFNSGAFVLINKVKDEIDRGNDDLTDWLTAEVPHLLHLDCHADAGVMGHYGSIMAWGNMHAQYNSDAKVLFSEFSNSDPFLVAAAVERGGIVVSQEVPAPLSKKSIKIPDVCNHFGVSHLDTFSLLRELNFRM